MPEDIINGELLPDGSYKLTTDKISGPNHTTAENLLRAFAKMTDGKVVRHPHHKGQAHGHTHQGQGEHGHE